MDAMMFLARMEEGAEERAQQLEEKRAKWEAEMEERRQERDRRHEERMQSQFFAMFQLLMGGGWSLPPTNYPPQFPIQGNLPYPPQMFPPNPLIPPASNQQNPLTHTEDEDDQDTPPTSA